MKHLWICLILLLGCQDNLELVGEQGSLYLKGSAPEIDIIEEIPWKVGKKRNFTVSQGVSFRVETPPLEGEAVMTLYHKFGIDSWIYRVRKVGSSGGTIGHAVVKLTLTKGKPEFFKVSQATIKILYAAAYASERFREFTCPAFNHRKRIQNVSLESESVRNFRIDTFPINDLNASVEVSFITPAKFNGGKQMQGRYVVELALFNSREKKFHGMFQTVAQSVIVGAEEEIEIGECVNKKPEVDEPRQKPKFDQFQWKR